MIGFQLQESPRDWPRAVAKLPPSAPNKFLDGVQRATEAKAANPAAPVVIRHHVSEQPRGGDLYEKARAFFRSFVDGSFLQIASSVDYVQEWNEYFADSQGPQERGEWVAWAHACADVWAHDYRSRPELRHIRLILAETAVGNDVPIGVAKIAHTFDAAVGYHPYVPVYRGLLRPDHWRWYSGRWDTMDAGYVAAGYKVDWFFGEFGAVGHNGPGWPNSLAANDGWRHPDVYAGNLGAYLDMMRQWLDRTVQTTAYREGRVIGATLFTSGGGRTWRHYEVAQPEMDAIAEFVSTYMATAPKPGTPPPPEPPPVVQPPPPTDTRYKRVVNLLPQDATIAEKDHVVRQVHDGKESIMQSADDAGFLVSTGRADSFVRVWGVERWGGGDIQTWLRERYGAASHAAALPRIEQTSHETPQNAPILGVDVSHWQGAIDWQKMREQGVVFAYIKASDGASWQDPQFRRNWQEAKRAGILRGAYHYYRNVATPGLQVQNFLTSFASDDIGELPPALDLEDSEYSPAPENWQQWLKAVGGIMGRRPIIYTGAWYWRGALASETWAAEYPLWLAWWGEAEPIVPKPWQTWAIWQYLNDAAGKSFGAQSSALDLNRFRGTLDDLRAL